MKSTFALLIFLIFAGCAMAPRINTSSGRPEITICGPSKNELMDRFVTGMIKEGVNIRNVNAYQVITAKPADSAMVSILYGSRYDSTPEARSIWTFSGADQDCTHIGVVLQLVTNPGSAFERIHDFSKSKAAAQLQQQLEQFKRRVDLKYSNAAQAVIPEQPDSPKSETALKQPAAAALPPVAQQKKQAPEIINVP